MTQGVEPPERVVTTGFARLTDGTRVTVKHRRRTGRSAASRCRAARDAPAPAAGGTREGASAQR